jgi:hypothetical protein
VSTANEITQELRSVLTGRATIADAVLPPIVFAVVNATSGVDPAAWAGGITAVAIVAWRLLRDRPLRFAISGLAGTALAAALALRSGQAQDYFIPGIVSNGATAVGLAVSALVGRPAVAFTSWITRSWPLDWYWHPRVRPAYTAVTWLWTVYFGLKAAITAWLYVAEHVELLAGARIVLGWPGLLGLLITTYIVGRRRLESLGGPSVEEFESGAEPPWQGQQSGF